MFYDAFINWYGCFIFKKKYFMFYKCVYYEVCVFGFVFSVYDLKCRDSDVFFVYMDVDVIRKYVFVDVNCNFELW